MTIKALQGGKLLCLMAAVAGAMTLGSCKDDDDEPEPTPAPVPTPQKVTVPNEFYLRLNNGSEISVTSKDTTINAKTLLSLDSASNKMKNSDVISFDIILRNNVKVDPAKASLTYSHSDFGKVDLSGSASYKDSIYSVTVPAMPGKFLVSVNGFSKTITVEDSDLNMKSRYLSNILTIKLDSTNQTFAGVTFNPYKKVGLQATDAHLSSNTGKFIALSSEDYNAYIVDKISNIKDNVADKGVENEKYLQLKEDVKYFAYYTEDAKKDIDKIFLGTIDFAGGEAKDITLSMSYSY